MADGWILMNFETPIKGDCTVDQHTDWITLDTFHWSVGRALTMSGGGQDRDTAQPSFSEAVVTKNMDIASTELWRQALCGKSLGKCTIHFIQTGGPDSKVQILYEIILHDAIPSNFSSSSSGARPVESLSINFTKVEHHYNQFTLGGTPVEGEVKNWDIKANATF